MPVQVFVTQPQGTEKLLALEMVAVRGIAQREWRNCITVNPFDEHYRRGFDAACAADPMLTAGNYRQLAMQESDACIVIPFPADIHTHTVPRGDRPRVDQTVKACVDYFHSRDKDVFVVPPDFAKLEALRMTLFVRRRDLKFLTPRQAKALIAALPQYITGEG